MLAAMVVLLIGGGYVGAMLSSSLYTLEIDAFRGVKVSQAFPLVYAFVLIYKEFYYEKGVSVFKQLTGLVKSASKQRRTILVCGAVLLLLAVTVFILRTGDRILSAGSIEQKFRNFLENGLLARPRTKEFLIAWPALTAGLFLANNRYKNLSAGMLFAASVGCASVCNTFCHIRAYFMLSLNRSLIGLALGLVIGFALSLILIVPIFNDKLKKRLKIEQ